MDLSDQNSKIKVLYIGSCKQTAVELLKVLSKQVVLDCVLTESSFKDAQYSFGVLQNQHLQSQQLISFFSDKKNLSPEQKDIYIQLKKTNTDLFKTLTGEDFSVENKVEDEYSPILSQRKVENIFNISEIKDIQVLSKIKKYRVLLSQSENRHEYDHLIYEESWLNLSQILKFKDIVKTVSADNSYQFVGLKYLVNQFEFQNPFWLIQDAEYKSIYDNYLFLKKYKSNELHVWFFIPMKHLYDINYLQFLNERYMRALKKQYPFAEFKSDWDSHNKLTFLLHSVNTGFKYKMTQSKKMLTPVSSCHFFNHQKTNSVISRAADVVNSKLNKQINKTTDQKFETRMDS